MSSFTAPLRSSLAKPSSSRLFSTTSTLQTKTIQPQNLPAIACPPYPYGPRLIYKQSNKGLYGTTRVRFGNNVSAPHKVKTQRFWRPNVHIRIYDVASLGCKVRTKLTMRVLKTIKKEGGLENYLLKEKAARIKELGPTGWKLRWAVMQTKAVRDKFNEERLAKGLEPRPWAEEDARMLRFALDHATPGKLSIEGRGVLAELKARDVFTLGNEELGEVVGEAITDETEPELLAREELEQEVEVGREGHLKP